MTDGSGRITRCRDDDECARPDVCDPTAVCRNTVGGFECYCPDGRVPFLQVSTGEWRRMVNGHNENLNAFHGLGPNDWVRYFAFFVFKI